MPIQPPVIEARSWEQLRDELIARIPTHTPEWTNYNAADPGVTLLELFAFLGENILYRANRIPERNRLAFLQLLGLPLLPGTPANALVSFRRANRPPTPVTTTLSTGLELRAGKLAYHLNAGLDVLPVESFVCSKKKVEVTPEQSNAYLRLYASLKKDIATNFILYQTTPLGPDGIRFGSTEEEIDGSVWIAFLATKGDDLASVRKAIAGRVLSIGLAPEIVTTSRDLKVGQNIEETPGILADLCIAGSPNPTWYPLGTARGCLERTGVVNFVLPGDAQLTAWTPADVTADGTGDAPPALADSSMEQRLLVWLRIRPASPTDVRLRWVGINAAMATQGNRVYGEVVATGTGAPDQEVTLSQSPVIEGSLQIWVGDEEWSVTEDVGLAAREGTPEAKMVQVDWEAGVLRFGTGLRGERPARGAIIRVSYEVSAGDLGNVGVGAINQSAGSVPMKVENPVAAWGGTAAETVEQGERQVAAFLKHRDRLVTADDFETIVQRTPGVTLARVEVLPAFHPLVSDGKPGDAPGCVTVLVIPPVTAVGGAPVPTDTDLQAICDYLDPRRLVTTEICLRGPEYVNVIVSVGVVVKPQPPGSSVAEVLQAVRQAILDALSPVPTSTTEGWPLTRTVRAEELFVVAASIPGVQEVNGVLVGKADGTIGSVTLKGLQLPWLSALQVRDDIPLPLNQLLASSPAPAATLSVLPLPVIPDECR